MLCDAGSSAENRAAAIEGILWSWRVRRLRALVVSHRDLDHCRFVPDVVRKFDVDKVVVTPLAVGEEASVLDEKLLDAKPRRVLVTEGALLKGDGLRCEVMHPDDRFLVETGLSSNERSLVLMCEFRGWRILFTGDVEEEALKRLVDHHGDGLLADVLVLPHHGAWRESLPEFLKQVHPRIAVASCYDVDERTRRLVAERGVPMWTTARHGAVTMVVSEGELKVQSYLRPQDEMRLTRKTLATAGPTAEGAETP